MIDTSRNIDDLLPDLRTAALTLRRGQSESKVANGKTLDALIRQVGERWGFNTQSHSSNYWNDVIDALDTHHPLWRGYIPGQHVEQEVAA